MQPISLSTSQEVSLDSFSEIAPNVDTKKIVNPLFEKMRTLSPFDNLIDMNIVNIIFSFLNHSDFNCLRLLNKTFREFADSPELYSPDIFKLKTVCIEYNEKSDELKVVDTELEYRKMELMNELTKRKESWFGYLVSLINFPSGILSIITTIFTSIFSSIEEEIRSQNVLAFQISGIKNFNLDSQTASRNKIARECYNLKSDFDLKRGKAKSFQQMMNLFGGKKEYDALPEFDKGLEYIEINNIKSTEMSAPIMRGIDIFGRNFFTIRFGYADGRELKRQIFFERYQEETSWATIGDDFVHFGSLRGGEKYVINERVEWLSKFNEGRLEQLKAGIQNKHHEDFFIQ